MQDAVHQAAGRVQHLAEQPTMYGGGDVRVEYQRLIRLWRAGRLDLEAMVTARLPPKRVNEALDLPRAGSAARTIIEF